jgi:hypothetical protein
MPTALFLGVATTIPVQVESWRVEGGDTENNTKISHFSKIG